MPRRLLVPVLVTLLAGAVLSSAGCGEDRAGSVTPGADPARPTPAGPATGAGGAPAMPTRVPPSGGASPNPPPIPDGTQPAPGLTPVDLLPGTHARIARWTPAGREGPRILLLDVRAGGPPCDAVTDVDVRETAASVRITVHAGVVAFEGCGARVPDPSRTAGPGASGVIRIRVHLAQPLGPRRLFGG